MSRFIFLFDLDATLTKQEILPAVSKEFGLDKEMGELTECAIRGDVPYKESFLQRVELLKDIPVSRVAGVIGRIRLNSLLADFVKRNRERCYIVTGVLDVWIEGLAAELGMEKNVFSSRAVVKDNHIQNVSSVVDKHAVISQMILPCVAVGDGNNDAEMMEEAEVGIGYGGVRDISPAVLECASHVIYDERKLVEFLDRLL